MHKEKKERKVMAEYEERPCKVCKQMYVPKVEWQKYCSDTCHDVYWKGVYQEKAATNKRLEKIEKELGIK